MGAQGKLFALELKKSSWTVVQFFPPLTAFAHGACRPRNVCMRWNRLRHGWQRN